MTTWLVILVSTFLMYRRRWHATTVACDERSSDSLRYTLQFGDDQDVFAWTLFFFQTKLSRSKSFSIFQEFPASSPFSFFFDQSTDDDGLLFAELAFFPKHFSVIINNPLGCTDFLFLLSVISFIFLLIIYFP